MRQGDRARKTEPNPNAEREQVLPRRERARREPSRSKLYEVSPSLIRVVIADDHRLLLDALVAVLAEVPDISVVGVTHDPRRVLGMLRELQPDLLVLDYGMQGLDDWTLFDRVRRTHSRIPVAVLSGSDDPLLPREALARGACGYLHKSAASEDVAPFIRAACKGEKPFGDSRLPRTAEAFGLTAREEQVLVGLARGLSLAAIGRELQISRQTVKTHVENLYEKLDVHSRVEAARTLVDEALLRNPYGWA